jgi:hypothetical protein
MAKTLFEKVWDRHVVSKVDGGQEILFIDRHLIHEVTSPHEKPTPTYNRYFIKTSGGYSHKKL